MAIFPNANNYGFPAMNGGFYGNNYPVNTMPAPGYNWNGGNQMNNFSRNVPREPMMIPGKLVTNENEIVPEDVPMNGTVALFPTKDYNMIFAKAWQSNGQIATVVYAPVQQEATNENTPTVVGVTKEHIDAIMQRLDNIEKMLAPWQDTSTSTAEGGK